MKTLWIIGAALILIVGCGKRNYYIEEAENPVYKPNKAFEAFEDMSSSKAEHLIKIGRASCRERV